MKHRNLQLVFTIILYTVLSTDFSASLSPEVEPYHDDSLLSINLQHLNQKGFWIFQSRIGIIHVSAAWRYNDSGAAAYVENVSQLQIYIFKTANLWRLWKIDVFALQQDII